MFNELYESLTYEFLMKNVEEDDVFLNIGAYIGLYAVRLALKVLKVVPLEPHPKI